MESKTIFLVLLPISIIILGIVLNFQEFLMGSQVSIKNLIVSLVYLAIWIVAFRICSKIKNRIIMRCYSVFWLLTLILAMITVFVNLTEVNLSGAIPFVILFLTQWYGIDYFIDSHIITLTLVSLVSLIMFIATIHLNMKWKKELICEKVYLK
jgi:hypothetical protein